MIVFAAFAALVMVSCRQTKDLGKTKVPTGPAWYQNMTALESELATAIADAKVLTPSKISHTLMPIRKDWPGEEWKQIDGRDMVLCVTLVDSSRLKRFFSGEGVYRMDRTNGTWITIPAEWKSKKKDFEGLDSVAAHMRMVQMYGLSPDCTYNIMVSFYADPKGMFRPSHDPDITTVSAPLDFPSNLKSDYTVGETNFMEWYKKSVYDAYEDDSPLPWTQLGYTYDWHKGANRQGLSEYIVTHHTLIKVASHESQWSFIKRITK